MLENKVQYPVIQRVHNIFILENGGKTAAAIQSKLLIFGSRPTRLEPQI